MQYDEIENYSDYSPDGFTKSCPNFDDLIFNVTPFMAHLVDNIECSFFTKKDSVIVSDMTETSLYELLYRLSQCNMVPATIDCFKTHIYGLSFLESDMRDELDPDTVCSSLKLLKGMVKAFSGITSSISLHSAEVHITNLGLDSMDTVAKVLKSLNVKPKRVFSDSNSLYSFELLQDDICSHQDLEDSLKQITNNSDYFNCLRSLRMNLASSEDGDRLDPVVEKDEKVSSVVPPSFKSSEIPSQGRGRPKRLSLMADLPKRKRGRPRLTEFQTDFLTFFSPQNANISKDSASISEPSLEEERL